MLRSLHIENMAVIRKLDFDFSSGLTVFTGETGAGKSVITDSVNFLVCNRITRDLIRTGSNKALVSAVFSDLSDHVLSELTELGIDPEDGELIIERSLTAEGKTSCRIDGRPVTQQIMRRVGARLISIHGQHDSLRLAESQNRMSLVDTMAKNEALLSEYSDAYLIWHGIVSDIAALKRDSAEISRMRDMYAFQAKEISSAKLKAGEEEELVAERTRLQSAERIKKHCGAAARTLYANEKGITASALALHAAEALAKVSDVVAEFGDLSARLRSCTYELDDIASELAAISADMDLDKDPTKRLDEIEARLALITRLKRKYGSTVEEIIAFGKDAEERLNKLENSDSDLEELLKREVITKNNLSAIADKLTDSRRKASSEIEKNVCESLRFLDMPKVRFSVSVIKTGVFTETGNDEVEFLIAANQGEPLMPLSSSASGGELSRVMLALKCALAEADSTATLIFDEVDTGISGKTSRKVGIKLKQAARSAQVLSVTHSAQIASLAHEHLLVSKSDVDGRAETQLIRLDREGRISETARILGGINVSEAQRLAAIDMIDEGENY